MDPGAVLIVVFILFVLVPSFLMLGGIVSALIGWTAKTFAEKQNEGSDLIETNY